MDDRPNLGLDDQISAALDWWREAGVACDFVEEATNWLANAQAGQQGVSAPQEAASPRAGGDRGQSHETASGTSSPAARGPRLRGDSEAANTVAIDLTAMPQSLEEFSQWWLAEPSLDQGRTSGRVPPRGTASAELMVLVPHPEREDDGWLLSGPQGRLLEAMLAAMGIPADAAYVASVLPRHTPYADWQALAASGLPQIIATHVELVGPKRLVAFGGNILPLLQHDPANNPADLPFFNHKRGSVPLLRARELGVLLERPRWKAGFWQDWLGWVG